MYDELATMQVIRFVHIKQKTITSKSENVFSLIIFFVHNLKFISKMEEQGTAYCKIANQKIFRHTRLAAGYDIPIKSKTHVRSKTFVTVNTGVVLSLPSDVHATVEPRSSMTRAGIIVQRGIIDADYEGEIHVTIHNISVYDETFEEGDRIAQLVLHKTVLLDGFDGNLLPSWKTSRSENGFGSTGI